MSTNNLCFYGEIRQILCGTHLSKAIIGIGEQTHDDDLRFK